MRIQTFIGERFTTHFSFLLSGWNCFRTARERRLALAFVGVLCVLGLLMGGRALLQQRAYFKARLDQLENERMQGRDWLAERELWMARAQWLEKMQPVMSEARQESLKLMQLLEKTAGDCGLEIVSKEIKELHSQTHWEGIPIRLEVAGTFSSVARWLYAIQAPEAFIHVNELMLKPQESANRDFVTCQLEVIRLYHPLIK